MSNERILINALKAIINMGPNSDPGNAIDEDGVPKSMGNFDDCVWDGRAEALWTVGLIAKQALKKVGVEI